MSIDYQQHPPDLNVCQFDSSKQWARFADSNKRAHSAYAGLFAHAHVDIGLVPAKSVSGIVA